MCTNIPPTELHDIENALKTVILWYFHYRHTKLNTYNIRTRLFST
jgi:hypothetical protein